MGHAVIVAACIVGQPVQRWRGETVVVEPLVERDAVEFAPGGVLAGVFHRDGESRPTVIALGVFDCLHAFMEAFLLFALGGVKAPLRQQTFVPQAIAIDPFLRRGAKISFVVGRLSRIRITLQNAEFGQQFAHRLRFAAG